MKKTYSLTSFLSFLCCSLFVLSASAQSGKLVIKAFIGSQSFTCVSANGPMLTANSTINGGAPVVLVKTPDAVDAQLKTLGTNVKTISSARLDFYKQSANGQLQKIQSVNLSNVHMALSPSGGTTQIKLSYNTIEWTWNDGGKPAKDVWQPF